MFDMCDICAVTISQIRIITFQEHGGLSPNCQEKGGYKKGCMKDWYVSFNVHSFHNDIRNYSHDGWTFYSKLVWIQRYSWVTSRWIRFTVFWLQQWTYPSEGTFCSVPALYVSIYLSMKGAAHSDNVADHHYPTPEAPSSLHSFISTLAKCATARRWLA